MTARVSVIVAMHDAEATIGEALASLAAQTFADWEAIVVDDGSSDASPKIVAAAACADRRIRLIRGRENRGPSAARNAGLRAARGGFLGFLDADDWLPPHALECLVGVAEGNPGACAFGGVEYRGPQGEDLAWRVAPARTSCALDDLVGPVRLTIMTLTPREALADDLFDESLTICEDQDLWLRLALRGVRFVSTPEIVYEYRLRPGSLTRRFAQMRQQHERVMRRASARAAALGWQAAGVDCSPERLGATLEREALLLASMCAATGDRDGAGALFADAWSGRPLAPLAAVDLGLFALPYALCRSRHDWVDLPAGWLETLGAWWTRCEGAGWTAPGFVNACAALLPERIVTNERTADAIVHSLKGARAVTLLGFGANARLLTERLLARGVRIEARDDRFDSRTLAPPEGVAVAPVDAPLSRNARAIFTTLDDIWLLRRFGDRGAVRWSAARAELVDRLRPRIFERIHDHARAAAA